MDEDLRAKLLDCADAGELAKFIDRVSTELLAEWSVRLAAEATRILTLGTLVQGTMPRCSCGEIAVVNDEYCRAHADAPRLFREKAMAYKVARQRFRQERSDVNKEALEIASAGYAEAFFRVYGLPERSWQHRCLFPGCTNSCEYDYDLPGAWCEPHSFLDISLAGYKKRKARNWQRR